MSALLTSKVFDVSELVVLVTGGGTGIGLMIAKGLAANGAKVYIGGRRKEVLDKAVADHSSDVSGTLIAILLDVTDKASIELAVEAVTKNDGKLDVLVNNAGQVGPVSSFFSDPSSQERKDTQTLGTSLFKNESFEGWADLFSINLSSIFFVSTAFLGLLEAATRARESSSGGWSASIINITSISGQIKLSQNHATKAAANHLTKMLSTELALRQIPIRVNAISPGPFPSEMTDAEGGTFSAEYANKVGKGITKLPSERGGLATDIVGAAVYLASSASYYVNGQILTVDGGYVATNPSVV